jgi:hypothetical protein
MLHECRGLLGMSDRYTYRRNVANMVVCFTPGYARCGRSGSGRQVSRRAAPGSVPQLPVLQLSFLLSLRSLCRCRQPQLSRGSESLLVSQLPILQPLRASSPLARTSVPEVSCWGQRGNLSQLSLLPLDGLTHYESLLHYQNDNTPAECFNLFNTYLAIISLAV